LGSLSNFSARAITSSLISLEDEETLSAKLGNKGAVLLILDVEVCSELIEMLGEEEFLETLPKFDPVGLIESIS